MKTKNFALIRIALKAGLSNEQIRKKDFRGADFREADFREADFRGADFRGADFRMANFPGADFRRANFIGADFRMANFRMANFPGADFRRANFRDANFRGANLNYKINEATFGLTINCPEEGSFIAYKKCQGTIVKLLIPEDAKRSSATTYKCRASKAICLEIDGGLTEISSDRDSYFIYRVGETVTVADFDEDRWNECSTGIHFFMSRKMAEQYS